jgi:hypothetical protein
MRARSRTDECLSATAEHYKTDTFVSLPSTTLAGLGNCTSRPTRGSRNFAPSKNLEYVKDLLERKRQYREHEREKLGGS